MGMGILFFSHCSPTYNKTDRLVGYLNNHAVNHIPIDFLKTQFAPFGIYT